MTHLSFKISGSSNAQDLPWHCLSCEENVLLSWYAFLQAFAIHISLPVNKSIQLHLLKICWCLLSVDIFSASLCTCEFITFFPKKTSFTYIFYEVSLGRKDRCMFYPSYLTKSHYIVFYMYWADSILCKSHCWQVKHIFLLSGTHCSYGPFSTFLLPSHLFSTFFSSSLFSLPQENQNLQYMAIHCLFSYSSCFLHPPPSTRRDRRKDWGWSTCVSWLFVEVANKQTNKQKSTWVN